MSDALLFTLFTSILATSPQRFFRLIALSAAGLILIGLSHVNLSAQSPASVPSPPPAPLTAKQRMEESLARQRASVEKQMETIRRSYPATKWSPRRFQPVPADCEPLGEEELAPLVASAATAHQIKPEVLRAVIRQESGAKACAVSPKGAMGLMQLMPETAEHFRLTDPFDPAQNVQSGAQYLKQMLDKFGGDLKLALAAYNAGPARVAGNPPAVPDIAETRNYVDQILKELAPGP